MTDPNPYEVLGVPKSASRDQVRRAYKKRACKYHPDRVGGDPAKMRELNMAYAVLENPERRARFDNEGTAGPINTVDELARSLILKVLVPAIEAINEDWTNPLDVVRQQISVFPAMENERRRHRRNIEKLQKRLKRLKGPPENFIAFAIESQIGAAKEIICKIDRDEEIHRRALEILADYSYDTGSAEQRRSPPPLLTQHLEALRRAFPNG